MQEISAIDIFNAQYKILAKFLKNERKQEKFDKDVFMKLIAKVVVKSRNEITFVFNDRGGGKSEFITKAMKTSKGCHFLPIIILLIKVQGYENFYV